MNSNSEYLRTFCFILILLTVASCSLLKASPGPSSSFLAHGHMLVEMRERAPFHGIWFEDKSQFYKTRDKKKTIFVTAVEQGAISEVSSSRSNDILNSVNEDESKEIARYLRTRFINILKEKQDHLKYADVPDKDSLVLELAITELSPTNPVINVAGTAAGFFVPGGGLISRFGTGSIAIEGRIRDGNTGKNLFEFKDREADKLAIVNIKDFQRYAHVRNIIDDWATQFADLINTPPDYMVDDSLPFTLIPY